jgi:hypothetical protein
MEKLPDYWEPLLKLSRDDPFVHATMHLIFYTCVPRERALVELAVSLVGALRTTRGDYARHLRECSHPGFCIAGKAAAKAKE